MTLIGGLHLACGVVALAVGATIFLIRKGTTAHVRLGWIYVATMFALNGTGLCVYRLTGGWNLFHILAVVSLAMVAGGVFQALNRVGRPNWLWRHYHYMAWSYVGLLTASSNEAFVRIPTLKQLTADTSGLPALICSAAIVAVSGIVIVGKQKSVLESAAATYI